MIPSLSQPHLPYTIWYRMQPSDQTSLGRPTFMGGPPRMLLVPPRMASGDM